MLGYHKPSVRTYVSCAALLFFASHLFLTTSYSSLLPNIPWSFALPLFLNIHLRVRHFLLVGKQTQAFTILHHYVWKMDIKGSNSNAATKVWLLKVGYVSSFRASPFSSNMFLKQPFCTLKHLVSLSVCLPLISQCALFLSIPLLVKRSIFLFGVHTHSTFFYMTLLLSSFLSSIPHIVLQYMYFYIFLPFPSCPFFSSAPSLFIKPSPGFPFSSFFTSYFTSPWSFCFLSLLVLSRFCTALSYSMMRDV